MSKREVSKPVRFYSFDGRIAFFLLALIVWPRAATFWSFLSFAILLWILERNGWPLDMFIRRIFRMFSGNSRSSRPWWKNNE